MSKRARPRGARCTMPVVAAVLAVAAPPATAAAADQSALCDTFWTTTPITSDVTLTADLTCPPHTGLVVGASGVRIDLNGKTLSAAPGSLGVGVTLRGPSFGPIANVTVTNGRLQGFATGVGGGNMRLGTISELEISGAWRPIDVAGGEGVRIERNTVRAPLSGPGISARGDRLVVRGNRVLTPAPGSAGISVNGSGGRVVNNRVVGDPARLPYVGINVFGTGAPIGVGSNRVTNSYRGISGSNMTDLGGNIVVNTQQGCDPPLVCASP